MLLTAIVETLISESDELLGCGYHNSLFSQIELLQYTVRSTFLKKPAVKFQVGHKCVFAWLSSHGNT